MLLTKEGICMQTYHVYRKRFSTILYIDENGYPFKRTEKTPWVYLGSVVGAKNLCKIFLNTKYKRKYYKNWCRQFYVNPDEDVLNKLTNEDEQIFYQFTNDKGYIVYFEEIVESVHGNKDNYRKQTYKYRKDPVPYLSEHWFHSGYYRKFPKPYSKDKESIDEVKKHTRNYKIKEHHFPSSWDDIPKSNIRNRNWKKYRKTQSKKKYQSFKKLNDCLEYMEN